MHPFTRRYSTCLQAAAQTAADRGRHSTYKYAPHTSTLIQNINVAIRRNLCTLPSSVQTDRSAGHLSGNTTHPTAVQYAGLLDHYIPHSKSVLSSRTWLATLTSLRASCGAVYCNRSCLFVGVWLSLRVSYHDNSKLRASILKLGL